jgi:hypothetical protein
MRVALGFASVFCICICTRVDISTYRYLRVRIHRIHLTSSSLRFQAIDESSLQTITYVRNSGLVLQYDKHLTDPSFPSLLNYELRTANCPSFHDLAVLLPSVIIIHQHPSLPRGSRLNYPFRFGTFLSTRLDSTRLDSFPDSLL